MNKLYKILFIAIIGLFVAGITSASIPQYWSTVDSLIPRTTNTVDIGSTSKRVKKIWTTDMDISGAFTLGGTVATGGIDMASSTITNIGDADTDIDTYKSQFGGMGLYNAVGEGMEKYDEEIVSIFQSGHGFTYTSGGGSSSDDMDAGDFVIGTQSLKVVTDGAGTQSQVTKTGLTPFSIADKNIVITAKIDDSDTLDGGNQQAFIGFSSDDFATVNYYQYYNFNYPLRKVEPGGEWLTMSFTAPDVIGGSGLVDTTAITAVRIYLRGTGVTTLHINKISLVDKPKQAIVSFTFDDGPVSQYDEGKAYLSKYGFPATAYVIRDREENANYLSFAQMTELQDVHGWDISSHASTNFTTLNATEMEEEMLAIKNYLIRNGYKGGDHLAYPQGELNSNIVLPLMRKYFTTGRLSAAIQQEALPIGGNPYIIKPFSMRASYSTSTIIAEIDQAIAEKGWLIFVSHDLVSSGASGSDYLIANFQTVVDYVKTKVDSGDLKVRKMSDVVNQNPNAVETVDSKVGIGTNSPDADLHIEGTTASELLLKTTGVGDPIINFLTTNTANSIKMYLDESETPNRFYIDGSVDSLAQDTYLNVKATSGETAHMRLYSGNSNYGGVSFSSGSILRFYNDAQDQDIRFNIDDGGSSSDLVALDASVSRVGIGDTSPETKLDVNGGIRAGMLTADPCGAGYPEGTIFYNNTSNYYCYCDGTNDVKLHDPAAACF